VSGSSAWIRTTISIIDDRLRVRLKFPTREIAGQRDMVDPENRNERLDT
jgi:hypothetical protein